MSFKIAIDGPSAAGKSTVAKALARDLSFVYIDTGAMYRAVGLYFLRKKISCDDKDTIEKECDLVDIELFYENGCQRIKLNGEDVTDFIRTEEVSHYASVVSSYKKVRERLVSLQQKLSEKEDVIMDGRDIGTVVLPSAQLKIFLVADSKIRAERRYKELKLKEIDTTFEEVYKDLKERDLRDTTRSNSPLKKAIDAIEVDTSNLNQEEVITKIKGLYKEKVGL